MDLFEPSVRALVILSRQNASISVHQVSTVSARVTISGTSLNWAHQVRTGILRHVSREGARRVWRWPVGRGILLWRSRHRGFGQWGRHRCKRSTLWRTVVD